MKLRLINGYLHPLPEDFAADRYNPHEHSLEFQDVRHFEWLHTLTIEFTGAEPARLAIERSGGAWTWWDDSIFAVEAETNDGEGYGHPAIIYNGKAYCGFVLRGEHE